VGGPETALATFTVHIKNRRNVLILAVGVVDTHEELLSSVIDTGEAL
jgi:hypothetical protein